MYNSKGLWLMGAFSLTLLGGFVGTALMPAFTGSGAERAQENKDRMMKRKDELCRRRQEIAQSKD
uniref:YtxH domain-containing protein n=1 Tax=Romanomermis culicivorax TaxID=13658 RepID=A0A915HRQ9_ROMCU